MLGLAACGGGRAPAASATAPTVGSRVGNVAPELAGTSIDGHRLSLSAWRGAVVVVVFWASWCTPCQAEQPALNGLARELAPGGVHFAGVSVDATAAAAESYQSAYAVPYPSLFDTNQEIAVRYEVVGPPITFVIDRRGRIGAEIVGQVDVDQLRADIRHAEAAS